jgi:sortase A
VDTGSGRYVAYVQIQMGGLLVGGSPDVAYGRTDPMPEGNRALRCRACAAEYGSTADQQLPPEQHSSVETIERHPLAEVVELPTPIAKKRRWVRYSRRPVFKRRRRVACLVLGLLLLVAAGGVLLFSNPEWVGSEPVQRILSPAVGEAPKMVEEEAAENEASEGETSSEEAAEELEGTTVPDDPTLHLTVPRLGLYGHTVRNDDSEEALDQGAIKLPYTGFPWQEEDTNTYIACHRLGWSGTESYNQCLNLPSMQEGDKIFLEDTNDTVYAYRVVETLTVDPNDTWVTGPVAGEDMVRCRPALRPSTTYVGWGPTGPPVSWCGRRGSRKGRQEASGGS